MKKTYCNPTLKVVKIQTTQVIAASPTPNFKSGETTTTMETRQARFSGFDEEEE